MFAPKVAKAQTKAAQSPASKSAPQRSTLVARQFGGRAVDQAHMLQLSVGNRGNQLGDPPSQEAERMQMLDRAATPSLFWDFTKIPIFPPDQANRPQALSPSTTLQLPEAIQAKLVVGRVDDPLEHEAERVADQVMRMRAPALTIAPVPRQLSRKCASCEEEAKTLQPKPVGPAKAAVSEAPSIVHEVLRSPGQPLNAPTRAFFEPRFGHDFSHVRVHTDAIAAETARAVNALAYTVERNIVFAPGQYVPEAADGGRLLAHELAHVVQQHSSQAKKYPRVGTTSVNESGDRLQAEPVAGSVIDAVQTSHGPSSLQLGRVLRQIDLGEVDGQHNQDTQGSQPSQYIDIVDDLGFEPDDGQLQLFPASSLAPLLIQRQPDIPPPPPPFPTGPQMLLDLDNTELLYDLTCVDRRERGYDVFWDETTKKSFHGDVKRGEPTKCGEAPSLSLGRLPPDRRHIYTVGFFHTHPPEGPNCKKTKVGPTPTDLKIAKDVGLPGIVRDTSTPQASCADEHNGPYYFFGPPVRDHY